jgi:DNA polymerase-4
MGRVVLHLDLDSFFAAVEQRAHRELRDKPVAISAPRGQSIVTAVTYDAKKIGVKVGMSKNQARTICPELVFVTARMSAYQLVSMHVRSIIEKYCMEYETLGMDECFFEVKNIRGENIQHFDKYREDPYLLAELVAEKIRSEVKKELGLNISAGIASSKVLAKLATSLGKPNGLKIIAPTDELKIIREQRLEKITGIGNASMNKLRPLGYELVGDLSNLKLKTLTTILGKHQGKFMYGVVNNTLVEEVSPNGAAKTMAATRKLNNQNFVIKDIFEELLGEILTRLHKQNRSCRTIDVFLYGDEYGYYKKIDLMVATKDLVKLTHHARKLFKEIPYQKKAVFIGVSLGRLGHYSQLELEDKAYGNIDVTPPPDFRPEDHIAELSNSLYAGMPVKYKGEIEGRVLEMAKEGLIIEFIENGKSKQRIFDMNYINLISYAGLE